MLPESWKKSFVVPIFKKGEKGDPLNYIPISSTSTRLITNQIRSYLEENPILSNIQFGFREGGTIEDQLLLTYNSISNWIDGGYMIYLILFDFAKVYYTVNHQISFTKLHSTGIARTALQGIKAFLCNKKLFSGSRCSEFFCYQQCSSGLSWVHYFVCYLHKPYFLKLNY